MHVDHTCALIVGNIRDVNSLNSTNVKLVKMLNRCNEIHILAKTFWLPIDISITNHWVHGLPHPFFHHMMWVEKILRIPNNRHQMKNYYMLLVHFFQYILITWSIDKMIIIRICYLKRFLVFSTELQRLNVYFD